MPREKKKYNYMEPVLQSVYRHVISLDKKEVKRNNGILRQVLNVIIQKMKKKDRMFAKMHTRIFYGGSYYDGLKVGKPDEFDLDILLTLPKYAEVKLTNSDRPEYVHLQLKEFDKWEKQPEAVEMLYLKNLLDDKHRIISTKASSWIQGILIKALNDLPQQGNTYIFRISKSITFYATIHSFNKGGPAHMLSLTGMVKGKSVNMDVDLVPSFVIPKDQWPKSPYRVNPCPEKPSCFVIPQKPCENKNTGYYWRLSFQEQERVLLFNKFQLKPVAKLLKKLRNTQQHEIQSYWIKNVFLWQNEEDEWLWKNSSSYTFMMMLKKYKEMLDRGSIPFFWNKNRNFLEFADNQQIAKEVGDIIKDIENHPDDPYVFAKYLLSDSELQQVKAETLFLKKIKLKKGKATKA